MKTNNELAAKVAAVNRAHDYANQLYAQLVEVFRPLVGCKILKNDGHLLASVQKLLPALPCQTDLRVYRHSSAYSLAWGIQTCENADNHVVYHELVVYVGDLTGPVLAKITDSDPRRTDYTIAEIVAKREMAKESKGIYEAHRDACWPFGEDRS